MFICFIVFLFILTVEPRQYMIDFIRRLQDSKAVKMDYPNIFDESNVVSLFGILDPSSKGFISHEKYLKGSILFPFLHFYQ